MKTTASAFLLISVVAVLPLAAAWGKLGRGDATRSVVHAKSGMVAAAQPLAVQAGLDVLKRGGSAVDAAIATNACLGLMEPTANGLGGDIFVILWDPAKKGRFRSTPPGRGRSQARPTAGSSFTQGTGSSR
jgi:gamma-glutamyltranspeptidase / glutathione hydrolase